MPEGPGLIKELDSYLFPWTVDGVRRRLLGVVSPQEFGAKGDGVTDDSGAFLAAARASSRFYIPSGRYVLDSSVIDVNAYRFYAGGDVTLIIDEVEQDYSAAFFGAYQFQRSGDWSVDTQKYMLIINRFSGKTLARISSAYSDSDSHQIYLPIEAKRDGHGFMMRHGTVGGSSDILYQDSESRDLFYLKSDGDRDDCEFTALYNVTPGAGNDFDAFLQFINTAGSGILTFPAAPVVVRRWLSLWKRSTGTRKFQWLPDDATLDLKVLDNSDVEINTLVQADDDSITVGTTRSVLTSALPLTGRDNARLSLAGSYAASTLSWVLTDVNVFSNGKLRVSQLGSGGGEQVYISEFKCDGTTVTEVTSALNATVAQFTTSLSVVAGQLVLAITYAGGLGGSARYSLDVELVTNTR